MSDTSILTVAGKDAVSGDRAWIEDGIVYALYDSPLSINSVLAMIKACDELILTKGKVPMPLICIFTKNVSLAIKPSEIAKGVNTAFIKHLNLISLVGAPPSVRNMILEPASHIFFNNRLHICDTIEEAVEYIRNKQHITDPILEQ